MQPKYTEKQKQVSWEVNLLKKMNQQSVQYIPRMEGLYNFF